MVEISQDVCERREGAEYAQEGQHWDRAMSGHHQDYGGQATGRGGASGRAKISRRGRFGFQSGIFHVTQLSFI